VKASYIAIRALQWFMMLVGMIAFDSGNVGKATYFVACAVFWQLFGDWLQREIGKPTK
jgi:hypothetical protein